MLVQDMIPDFCGRSDKSDLQCTLIHGHRGSAQGHKGGMFMSKRSVFLFLVVLTVALLSAGQALAAAPPTTGLAAWYPFNGDVNDYSGNGNNMIPFTLCQRCRCRQTCAAQQPDAVGYRGVIKPITFSDAGMTAVEDAAESGRAGKRSGDPDPGSNRKRLPTKLKTELSAMEI